MTQLCLNLSELKREWIETASPIVLSTMRGREFTSDDLHEVLTEPAHVNWFGVLIARLANKGLVERTGYRPSQRREANGRIVSCWTVKPTTLQPA